MKFTLYCAPAKAGVQARSLSNWATACAGARKGKS